MSLVQITQDFENKLLGRRELKVKFKAGSGILSRQAAVDAIASQTGTKKENIQVISLNGVYGARDVNATAYVFSNAEDAKRQLADYVLLRHLPKDERKKLREEKRKGASAPASATPAPAAEAKA